jgi:PAS domain S-box-containing protein
LAKQTKKNTPKTDQKYQQLIENSLQGVVIIQDFRIVYSNPAFARITGYSEDELLALEPKELLKLVHPDDQSSVWGNYRKRMAGFDIPPDYNFKGMTKDGKIKIFDLYANVIDFEEKPALQGLILDITQQVEAEEKLRQRTKLIETIVNNLSLGIAVNEIGTGKYSFINKEFKDIFGLGEDEILDFDKFLGKVIKYPEHRRNLSNKIKTDTKEKKPENLIEENIEIFTKTGEKKYILAKKIPLYDQNLMIFTIQDVTERLKVEKNLKNSLAEKEILLREIHHRVKNNLQTISSLLDLQAESINEPKNLEVFRSSQSRIRSMALIHERLYKSEDLSKIKASEYINNLMDYLEGTYYSPSWNTEITTDIQNLYLDLDVAIPCGLIINELVSNSMKYAFPGSRKGNIKVSLQPDASENLVLMIKDDGIGIPLTMITLDSQSLGLQLVKLLVKQLNGKMEIDGTMGTRITIIFPKPPVAGEINS